MLKIARKLENRRRYHGCCNWKNGWAGRKKFLGNNLTRSTKNYAKILKDKDLSEEEKKRILAAEKKKQEDDIIL